MGLIGSLMNAASAVMSDYIEVDTGLPTLRSEGTVVLSVEKKALLTAMECLRDVLSISLPLERLRHLQLLDEHKSAVIEGARTSIESVIMGGTSKSDIMVRQSYYGLNYMLHNELSEMSLIKTWKIIVDGCCENTSAGVNGYRTGMVYVGGPNGITHIPAKPESVEHLMSKMFQYWNEYDVLNAIIYGFYLVYVHSFADGNGRTSRCLMQKFLGVPALPLSKVISINLSGYYSSLSDSEVVRNGNVDITPFADYVLNIIPKACEMFKLFSKPLDEAQSALMCRLDRPGKGCVSYDKAAAILKCSEDDAVPVIDSLVQSGYLEYDSKSGSFKVIWR